MKRFAIVNLLIVGSAVLAVAPVAAQEYAQETGDLDLTTTLMLGLSGDGFVADSVVLLTLTSDDTNGGIDLGTLETDSDGAFSGSITLPDGLEPGTYTLSATGVTEDGATRVLSASVTVGGEVTTGSTTTTTTSTTTTLPDTTTTAPATTTSETGSTTTIKSEPPPEPADDSNLLVFILLGIIVIQAGAIGGGLWWYYRRS